MKDIVAMLDALAIASVTHGHPPVATIDEARAHWALIVAAHTKNLLLKDAGGAYWLVVMPAEMSLDLKALPARIGSKRLRFAPPDDLARLLGVPTGAVSAFALVNDTEHEVTLVIDSALMRADAIAQHPLDNTRTTVLAPAGLLAFLDSIGHKVRVTDL